MSEEETKLEWQKAIAEFSKISDGFGLWAIIMGAIRSLPMVLLRTKLYGCPNPPSNDGY